MDLTQVLEATLSPDTQVIQLAQQQLEQAAQTNLGAFMTALSTELADVGKSEVARMAAGLQLKNYLTAKNPEARLQRQQAWFSLDPQIRAHVKTLVLRTLGTETRHGSAAQCVAYIAAVDLPTAQWPEVMQVLLANITSAQATEALKEASLQAIGYICEELDPKLLASQANEILTAIVQGMRKEEPSNAVRLAATTALLNSLEFTKANFEKESERHFIMQVVCEATQCISVPVQVAALQCLVKIMSLYYVYMESYMGPALFAITLEAMKSNVNEVALQGIEFWSSVCDEEADLAIEAAEAAAEGRPPENISRFYVKGAASYLVPILLLTLTKQEEYDDEDDWNPCKAAGVCLSLMASCCEDEIVPHVTPFVKAHITNEEWRFRDAAIMALGSILEGPDPNVLQSPVSELTETLIGLMNDPMVQVKDSAVWTIGRVCELIPAAVLNDQCLLLLLQALVAGLAGEPRVAINACWALSALAEAAYDMAGTTDNDEEPETFCLSNSYALLVTKLISAADRPDAGAGNLRNSAYQALMDLIKYSAKDCYEVIQGTTMEMMKRLQQVLQIDSQRSGAERQELVDLECLLCATLQSLLRKVNQDDAMKIAETVMSVLLMILQSSSTQQGGGVHEDAIQTVGVLVEAIGKDFAKYMESFAPFLKHALKNALEYQVCIAAVALVGDLCRALMDQMLPYCDDIMTIMVENLSHAAVHRSVKPPILSAIGDIALAIGPEFKKYLPIVFNILQQAANLQEQLDKSDFDLLDYINELRDGCLEAYTGIIQGLKGDDEKHLNPDVKLAEPQVPFMVQFIGYIANDEERSESNVANSLGLLGDLVVAFGKPMVDVVSNTPGVLKMLQEGKISRNKRTKALANWASKEIKSQQKQRTD